MVRAPISNVSVDPREAADARTLIAGSMKLEKYIMRHWEVSLALEPVLELGLGFCPVETYDEVWSTRGGALS